MQLQLQVLDFNCNLQFSNFCFDRICINVLLKWWSMIPKRSPKYSIFHIFSLFSISFKNSSWNFNGDIFLLGVLSVDSGFGWVAYSDTVFFFCKYFISEVVKNFSLALQNSTIWFRKDLFWAGFIALFDPLIYWLAYLALHHQHLLMSSYSRLYLLNNKR